MMTSVYKITTPCLFLLGLMLIWQSCSQPEQGASALKQASAAEDKDPQRPVTKIPDDAITGDFNGDKQQEFIWLTTTNTHEEDIGDTSSCFILCSNNTIPPLKVDMCIGGNPVNLGDLNGDGADELGLLPDWWTSCWRSYFVYTLKTNRWKQAVSPINTHCIQWDQNLPAIEKDSTKPGFVIIRYSELTDTDIVVKTKSIPIER